MENKIFNLMIMSCEMWNNYRNDGDTNQCFIAGQLTAYRYTLEKLGYGTFIEYKNGMRYNSILSLTLSKDGHILREIKFEENGFRIPVISHRHFLGIVHYMDDDQREKIHADHSPCTDEQFLMYYIDENPAFLNFILSEGLLTPAEFDEIEAMGE